MKSIIFLFFSTLFIILHPCGSFPEKNGEDFTQEDVNQEIQSDAYTGKVFSGGIGWIIDNEPTDCDGLTYSEYGSYLLFLENQQVKVYGLDSSPGMFYVNSLLSGTYKVEADKIILTIDNESILRWENLTFEFSDAPTLTKQIPNKKISRTEIYNLTTCSNKPALRKEGEDLFYIEMDADFTEQTKQAIAKHEKEVQESSTMQDSQLSGTYISNEEGVMETITLEVRGSNWKLSYISRNIQEHITLNVKNINVTAQSCEVSFPNDANTFYKMKFNKDGKLSSTDIAGKVQNFMKR